ncbi:HAD family hydrolase [Paremcibacter congregatus]|uniref:HAD family hydrolase n=2 Tax=Paremcibacter congregatus TaxID=2043170 RepID=A0A2G4YV55_9PROT|nr:HAD family hydrolase [Paremcibacter congregatus]QDE27151.1 HAD family phosphatase [Paremcibacter congregatus]
MGSLKMSTSPHIPITALVFDIGNVVVKWDPRFAYKPLFDGREEELDYFLTHVCTLAWHTRHDQGVPFNDNITRLQQQFPDHHEMIGLFETLWDQMFDGLIEETIALLYQLDAQQHPLYALTNFPAEKFTRFQQKHAFTALFKDSIVSGTEKITKPDPRLYEILLKRVGVAAQNILFIDDRMENLQAAEIFGIQTHLFTTPARLEEDLISRDLLPD